MMPALLIRTLRSGCSAIARRAKSSIAPASPMSSVIAAMCSRPAIARSSASCRLPATITRSEEHTSELQSLMRISYAVFCLKKKNNHLRQTQDMTHKQQVQLVQNHHDN